MEKTLARAIYKRMKTGKEYTSYDLFRLVEDVYYNYIPVEMQGKDVRKICGKEMWNIVNAGYATTRVQKETYNLTGGLKFGKVEDWSKQESKTYTVRYWVRIK